MDNPAYTSHENGADVSGPHQRTSVTKSSDPVQGDEGQSQEGGDRSMILEKRVGLFGGISMIVGTMIGSGIFISPKGVTEGSGSVGFSLVSWAICGIIATMGALSYAELGTMITKSGGEYAYLSEAIIDRKKKYPIAGYLFAWMSVFLLKPGGCAIIALTCAEYLTVPFFDDGCGSPPQDLKKCIAVVVLVLLAALNCYSVKIATNIQIIFTVAKLIAVTLIVIGGFVMLAEGRTQHLATGFQNTEKNVGKIAIGFYNGMWAYDGWNNLNYVTEEIINPSRNLPLSILIGLPLVTVLYLLVNISYFTVMSVPELLASPAVAVTWAERVIPSVKWIMPISVAMSTFGAANGTLFTTGRLCYVAAREGHMLEVMSMINVRRKTPFPSLVFTTIMAIIFVIPGDIGSLIDVFNFAVWMFYGLTMMALIVMRWTHKDLPRPYKVPIVIPFVVFFASLFLVIVPIIQNPQIEFLYATLFILAGLVFYVPFVHFQLHPPFMGPFTTFMQLLMESSPPMSETELAG